MGSARVYVFDVDGVLLDVSERLRVARERARSRNQFWETFFSPQLLELDKPRRVGIDLLLDRARKGLIAIVSGRPRKLLSHTIKQLTHLCGIPAEAIWRIELRDEGDRRPSHVVKLEKVLGIAYEGFSIEEVHDDDEQYLHALRRYLPKARLYLHRGEAYEVL